MGRHEALEKPKVAYDTLTCAVAPDLALKFGKRSFVLVWTSGFVLRLICKVVADSRTLSSKFLDLSVESVSGGARPSAAIKQ